MTANFSKASDVRKTGFPLKLQLPRANFSEPLSPWIRFLRACLGFLRSLSYLSIVSVSPGLIDNN